jgi:hypothetical protein
MRSFRRLYKSHSGKRGVVLGQFDAGLQFQCLKAERPGFRPRRLHERFANAAPMPVRPHGKLADLERVLLRADEDATDQSAPRLRQQERAIGCVRGHRLRRQPQGR